MPCTGVNDKVVDVSHPNLIFDTTRGPKALVLLQGADHDLAGRADAGVPIIMEWTMTLMRRHIIAGNLAGKVSPPEEAEKGIIFGEIVMR